MSKNKIRNPVIYLKRPIDDVVVRGSSHVKDAFGGTRFFRLSHRSLTWNILDSINGGIRICLKQSK